MQSVFLYATATDADEATRIARPLVEKGLVACVNILEGMRSVYRWEGELREDREAVVVMKTRSDLVEEVTQLIKELHSYDCPCVVALPIEGGDPEFLAWIQEQTEDPG